MDPVSSNTGDPVSSEAILQQLLLCDELWAKAGGDRTKIGLAQREKLKRASGSMHRKRLRTAELHLGAGQSHWMVESERSARCGTTGYKKHEEKKNNHGEED